MSKIILFGAGASSGSGEVSPYPPPLGKDLFDRLDALGKTASKIPPELKDVFRRNFEDGMRDYVLHKDRNIMSFQRELAGYLAAFEPGEKNHYIELLKGINSKRVIFASLNYDLLLEISAIKLGLNILYDKINTNNHIRILKIHGSCNFWPNDRYLNIRDVSFEGVFKNEIVAPIKPLNQKESIYKSENEDSTSPAMSMYAEGKEVRVSPNYVAYQQEMWFQSLKKCPTIFIIGVRVHQADEHIWTMIAKSKAQVHYYGLPVDLEAFDSWKEKHNKKNATFHLANFAQAVPHILRIAN